MDENKRKKIEDEYITLQLPIMQSDYKKYYPRDKAKKDNDGNWVKREDIPSDWFIRKDLRKEAIKEKIRFENHT